MGRAVLNSVLAMAGTIAAAVVFSVSLEEKIGFLRINNAALAGLVSYTYN